MYGWTGKILDVDLNSAQTCQIDTEKYSGKYIEIRDGRAYPKSPP